MREEEPSGAVPHLRAPAWSRAFPWLIHGVTRRWSEGEELDFRIRGPAAGEDVLRRWDRLREGAEADTVIHTRQVHGSGVRVHRSSGPGLLLVPPCDGHVTGDGGVLLTVSVADCVPVFLVAPGPRVVGLLHVGWRGLAAGIMEEGIRTFQDRFAVDPEGIHAYLGPAISAEEYEVGPEVFSALGLSAPEGPSHLDLRAAARRRAVDAGVLPERIGVSARCTRQDESLFSHRGGDAGRQVAFLGIRSRAGALR